MAINPVLTQDLHTKQLIPHCASGEFLLLLRGDTKFEVTIARSRLKGAGDTFLTTHRIVFIKKRDKKFNEGFSSISLPFTHLDDARFRQPLFWSNYLEGTIHPVSDAAIPLSSSGKFNLYFDGGCQAFLQGFYMCYARVRNNPNVVINANVVRDHTQTLRAYVDPNDPTHIYFVQPETTSNEAAEGAAEGTDGDRSTEAKGNATLIPQAGFHASTQVASMLPFRL